MTAKIPNGCRVHGILPQTELLAGVLPRNGLHFLAGQNGDDRDTIVADIAVAVASDVVTCGLGPADKSGARSSLSGFFGLATGASTGVAITTDAKRAVSLSRAIAANALLRGVSQALPVAVMGGYSAESVGFRLHDLEQFFKAEYGSDLGLIIVDVELPAGELLALQRQGRTVLSVAEAAPTTLPAESVVLVIGKGVMTVAKPFQGSPWAKGFALETIMVSGVESLVVKPGEAASVAKVWQAAPVVVAPAVKEPELELPITSKVVILVTRGEVPADLRAKWTGMGFEIAHSPDVALPKPGEIEGGRREIMIAGDGDQRPEDLKSRATKLGWEAMARGVAKDVTIRVAA